MIGIGDVTGISDGCISDDGRCEVKPQPEAQVGFFSLVISVVFFTALLFVICR